MGKHKSTRVGVTIQLVHGEDSDLIDWYNSLPQGERQVHIKEMLRTALGMNTRPRRKQQHAATNSQDAARIAQLEQELDHLRQISDQWFAYLNDRIENRAAPGPAVQAAAPILEEDDSLDTEQLNARRARLNDADW